MECPNGESFYTVHNEKWATQEGCCPQYFNYLNQHDARWPKDEHECMERFHEQRTLKLLREFVFDIGVFQFQELSKAFPEVTSIGFSLSKIMQTDPVVIKRTAAKEEAKRNQQPLGEGEKLPDVEEVTYEVQPLLGRE